MASEIGYIYTTGRHWTGSMVELGFGQSESRFQTAHSWTASEEDSAFGRALRSGYFSRHSRKDEGDLQKLITQECVLQHLLGTTAAKTQGAKGASCTESNDPPRVLESTLARYLLEVIKQKSSIRHSLTSLLPTEGTESQPRPSTETATDISQSRSRHFRCHSSEPGFPRGRNRPDTRSLDRQTLTLSSLCLEASAALRQLQTSCPISPQRKRLSLSDSEICYAEKEEEQEEETKVAKTGEKTEKNAEDAAENEADQTKEQEKQDEKREEKEAEASEAQHEPSDAAAVPVFVIDSDGDGPSSNTTTPIRGDDEDPEEQAGSAVTNEGEASPPQLQRRKKSVRFADEIGSKLCEENMIADTSLPPILSRMKFLNEEDDFYAEGLPGVRRPNFPSATSTLSSSSFGPKHSISLPDMLKMPPSVPGVSPLHRSLSTTEGNPCQQLPQLLGSPLRSPTSPQSGWRITFAQPAVQYLAFRQRLETKCVSLENVSMSWGKQSPDSLCLYGTVKVKNIAFAKRVILRATSDKWRSQHDFPAVHDPQLSSNGGGPGGQSRFDAFMFNFCIDFAGKPQPRELQFAVCFTAGEGGSGGEFWDNNDGCNYVVVEEVAAPGSLANDANNSLKQNPFFRSHPPANTVSMSETTSRRASVGVCLDGISSSPPTSAYKLDYRPNFEGFSSLTNYSSWQHYSRESIYY